MTPPARITALIMDGGGVRGLSTLLILQRLLTLINTALIARGYNGPVVSHREIFNFAAGTSTGGLIAIMLMRLNMSVDDCIKEYRHLSRHIFGKKKIRGRLTGGFLTTRYSGTKLRNCVRDLLGKYGFNQDELLVWTRSADEPPRLHCSVVCREEERDQNRITRLKERPVHFCSINCDEHDCEYMICDAARATSAAWTYFPAVKIGPRYFSDGGLKYNNPSAAIYDHYTIAREARETRDEYNRPSTPMPPIPTHEGLDFSRCRIVNIGTGSDIENVTPKRKRNKWAPLIPNSFHRMGFVKETLVGTATESEYTAREMRMKARTRRGELAFDRLSASNGVCWIKMDRYKKLQKIETLTREWLNKGATQIYMGRLANDIAGEYLDDHSTTPHVTDHLGIPEHAERRERTEPPEQSGPARSTREVEAAGGAEGAASSEQVESTQAPRLTEDLDSRYRDLYGRIPELTVNA